MGLLSSILQTGENILTSIGGAVGKVYENTLAKVPFIPEAKSFVEKNPEIVAVPLTAGLAVGATATKAAASKVVTSIPSLLPTTTKGKIVAAAATPVVIGATISQPSKVAQAVVDTPKGLFNVGGNLGNLVAEPSIKNVKTLVTENPVIVGGAIAAAAAVGAKGIIPAIATARQTEAIQEQTKAIQSVSPPGLLVESTKEKDILTLPPATNITPIPQTPQTKTISPTTTRRKKRKSVKTLPQNITQKVNVLVNNDNRRATKNYINREVLINK